MDARHWSRASSAHVTPETGDLVVACKRGSALDRLSNATDDPFHHIGIVVHLPNESGSQAWVIEHTFNGCTARTLEAFYENYDDVGLLNLTLDTEERARVHKAALQHLGSTPRYAWDEVFLVGMSALARQIQCSKESLRRGRFLLSLETAVHRRNSTASRAVFCTTFIRAVFADAGVATKERLGPLAQPAQSTALDLSPTQQDQTMSLRLSAQIAMNLGSLVVLLLQAAVLLASGNANQPPAFCSPSDLWRHIPATGRLRSQKATRLAPNPLVPARALEEQFVTQNAFDSAA